MTIWTPDLEPTGPRYKALANAIEHAIHQGKLAPGDKLPPQRQLADALGVTIGTITRGYGDAERRGLVEGRVGSGTYVHGPSGPAAFGHVLPSESQGTIDLSLSLPPPTPERVRHFQRALAHVNAAGDTLAELLSYQPESGMAACRQRFATWMTEALELPVEAEELVITQGGMHGIFISLLALLAPGERIACEELSYPGLISAVQQLHLKTAMVGLDEDGIDVAALRRRFEQQPFKAIYVMPEHHNPTTVAMSQPRREALVAFAREKDVWLIEDGVLYMAPNKRRGTPLYRLAPERTVYLFSVAKLLGGGLRAGVLRAPSVLHGRLNAALRAQSWMPPPLMASVACAWIEHGDADALLDWQTAELSARYRMAIEALNGHRIQGAEGGFYLWIHMPAGLRASQLIDELQRQNVRLTSGEAFCVGATAAPQAVRLCLSAAHDRAQLAKALEIVKAALDAPEPTLWETV
ncbi:PLP-dependent aminotransferase family protein [Larsenimonas salina]|uniref:aminotransferase-like domain-containing protein n=1 Tax=Larsenimonas salina TaxID=1295565 RepID=UPI0020741EF4|nr:PLP-dependent aminotransferase family protein [Larsenimonas salina]MCM5705106.1 PLP-dependent aminotransferase family protein [Larsenimonas salina]